jgi:hypothetical protein
VASNFYCADASSLLKLKQDFPSPSFPTLWDRVEQLVIGDRLFSPEEVLKEIENDDILASWAKQRKRMFRAMSEEIWEVARAVTKQFPGLAKPGKFSAAADPFVVALARCVNVSQESSLFEDRIECIVVTEEGGGAQQIPAACSAFGVKCVNLVGLIQREGWKF